MSLLKHQRVDYRFLGSEKQGSGVRWVDDYGVRRGTVEDNETKTELKLLTDVGTKSPVGCPLRVPGSDSSTLPPLIFPL